jgi:transcriptional regulator with GAF, ATPase, and Fis domain
LGQLFCHRRNYVDDKFLIFHCVSPGDSISTPSTNHHMQIACHFYGQENNRQNGAIFPRERLGMTLNRENPPSEHLGLLYRVSRALLREGEYGELLSGLLDTLIEGLGADRGFVVVRENGEFRATAARNFRSEALSQAEEAVSRSIARSVMENGKAILIGDASVTEPYSRQPSIQQLSLRSVLCAPLVVSDEAFALIYLENRQVTNCFTEGQRDLLDEVCVLAAPRLRTAVAMSQAQRRAEALEHAHSQSDGILTSDPGMLSVLQNVHQIATTDLPVLIEGETGTGKELIARAVYRHSTRVKGPFIALNCAAIPATLIGSELFGFVQGAFTGANRDRVGFIGAAHRGTLFLDEIGDLPLDLQPHLLRVLQSGEFTRLGTSRSEQVDVRFIAATNRDLESEVKAGRFRADLFFRLSAITLRLPPLRDRPHDIRLLAEHFARTAAARYGRPVPRLAEDCLSALAAYSFPGNVRELESEMGRLAALASPDAPCAANLLNERIRKGGKGQSAASPQVMPVPPMSLHEMEKQLIFSVLQHTAGNRTRAAEILGISREGLRTKLLRLQIPADSDHLS